MYNRRSFQHNRIPFFVVMAAPVLLYNDVVEQQPDTGEDWPTAGGNMTWSFRADTNTSVDLSQTYFAIDFEVNGIESDIVNGANTAQDKYYPDFFDFHPFFPLRLFYNIEYKIDGITVAKTTKPWMDKLVHEKYLGTRPGSSYGTVTSMMEAAAIDDGKVEHNPFLMIDRTVSSYSVANQHAYLVHQARTAPFSVVPDANATGNRTKTFILQPPFDFWKQCKTCYGGNHQITFTVRPQTDSVIEYGEIVTPTWKSGGEGFGINAVNVTRKATSASNTQKKHARIRVTPSKPRLYRRMVRELIERPLGNIRYPVCQTAIIHGEASPLGVAQNFNLPSSTYALAFYWTAQQDDHFGPFGSITMRADVANGDLSDTANSPFSQAEFRFDLDEFYFTYNGQAYPKTRLTNLKSGTATNDVMNYHKLQLISQQLQGTTTSPQGMSLNGMGMLDRIDGYMYFFPVARQNKRDNNVLQTYWRARTNVQAPKLDAATIPDPVNAATTYSQSVSYEDTPLSLSVVAFYDASIDMEFNAANQLTKITKTEWK